MEYSLGNSRASWSRKTDLIVRIQLERNRKGMAINGVKESTNGYRRKKVTELEDIFKAERGDSR